MKAIVKPVLAALLITLFAIGAQAAPSYISALGTVTATTVRVTSRLDGELISVNFKEGEAVQKGQLLAKIDGAVYRLQLEEAQSRLAWLQKKISDGVTDTKDLPQLQTEVALAQRRLSEADITAPVSGVAGFRLIDVGNVVHAGEPLVVIVAPQPIAVVFSVPQEELPVITQRLKAGEHPVVELWNRDGGTKKLATGPLSAVDNQIDPTTGTVKLKAIFENKDGALFPKAFVNVRVVLDGK